MQKKEYEGDAGRRPSPPPRATATSPTSHRKPEPRQQPTNTPRALTHPQFGQTVSPQNGEPQMLTQRILQKKIETLPFFHIAEKKVNKY